MRVCCRASKSINTYFTCIQLNNVATELSPGVFLLECQAGPRSRPKTSQEHHHKYCVNADIATVIV
jgi:hypothetical protein